jgi:cytochrome c
MKSIAFYLLAGTTLLTSGAAQADEALAKAKGCLACRKVEAKVLGPAYTTIAKKSKGKKDAVATLAQHIIKGTPIPNGKEARQMLAPECGSAKTFWPQRARCVQDK